MTDEQKMTKLLKRIQNAGGYLYVTLCPVCSVDLSIRKLQACLVAGAEVSDEDLAPQAQALADIAITLQCMMGYHAQMRKNDIPCLCRGQMKRNIPAGTVH